MLRRAIQRRRKLVSPNVLLCVLLMHASSGESLRATIARARHAGLCDVSDVALFHCIRAADCWLAWLVEAVRASIAPAPNPRRVTRRFRIRLVDSTTVSEPGSTGSDWRIHYSVRLAGRGYCRRRDISHVVDHGGHVCVLNHSNNLPLYTRTEEPWGPAS